MQQGPTFFFFFFTAPLPQLPVPQGACWLDPSLFVTFLVKVEERNTPIYCFWGGGGGTQGSKLVFFKYGNFKICGLELPGFP